MAGSADKEIEKASALAEALPAVRYAQPAADTMDIDISQVQHGARAITGKFVWSANNALRVSDRDDEKEHEKQEAREREDRELMHLAVWNAEKTIIGGVEMTNAEAQNARQRIIDNDDFFADRAVKQGRIGVDEKEEYKQTIRRIKDLEDRKGRGIISPDEKQECERLKLSRAGRAAEHDVGAVHAALHGPKIGAEATADGATPGSDDQFQTAPDLSEKFARAQTATAPLDGSIAPPAPKAAVGGLNL